MAFSHPFIEGDSFESTTQVITEDYFEESIPKSKFELTEVSSTSLTHSEDYLKILEELERLLDPGMESSR
ncbi:hypothetical protein CROQUDRAFT_658913 [Cronartium quercuum f. sp. fusiforme G11]|uniref:Uncharacterized protein n=1 Tax=Cronartium quercuum f. sp. fusiforme G11 TaxID=708437 RepID=A0A9P6NJC2_9BASI|nr:hypothetical protein CROQUDRAFT_658913 [Cronartium quercuum f. sp. fusiforme G11]